MDPFRVIQQIAPEITDLIEERYTLLRTVNFMAPVGRRTLASKLGQSERLVRRELDFLRSCGLVYGNNAGMSLTSSGERILEDLHHYMHQIRGLASLEDELEAKLDITKVIVVPGDIDEEIAVKQDLAHAAARYLRSVLNDGDILAVTGGSTLAQVSACFGIDGSTRTVTVVPARGGLGEDVNLQANTIAAKVAQGLGGTYRLLHAPDNIVSGLMETIMSEPRIKEVIELGRKAQVLLHGIGTAEEMARRRGLDEQDLQELLDAGAVGEAFGYYFDLNGKIVYSTPSVGLRFDDVAKIPQVIAVGGGNSKAWALLSVVRLGYCNVCITDEGAARRLIHILKNKEEN